MINYFGSFLALFCFVSFTYSQDVLKRQPSDWIDPVDVPNEEIDVDSGAYDYLLIDFQDNIPLEESYAHYAIKLKNSEGIQEFSDISASFDPSYQKLTFHKIAVLRDGKRIDKLEESTINTFQRESNLERSLYDGSITAVINLTDIRKGDIIEYAYTIQGFNPINKGNYSSVVYQQYTSPVTKIYNRVVAGKNKPVYYKLLNNALPPTKKESTAGTEYIWDVDGSDYFQYDVNVPYWLNLQKRVSLTTFKDWSSLTNLMEPLYQPTNQPLDVPHIPLKNAKKNEETIIELIRFVQDDVRYLGFESGIGAYKPHNPKKVLQQRYGDCKDKSMLLVNLLQNLGVSSYPFLVNTDSKDALDDLLPGLNLFNHCIVYFEHDGQSYYVDPTMANQGGSLKNYTMPKYGKGLLLKPNSNSLVQIPEYNTIPTIKVEETITTDSIGGNAIFLVKSTYTGSRANYMRDYFLSNTQESINTEFVNYYSSLYPSIESTQAIQFTDEERNGENKVVIEEYYNISPFWTKDEDTGLFICETLPLVLQGMLEYTNSPQRTMPYYLGEPFNFEQETTLSLPESWNASESDFESENESYSYSNEIRTFGKTIRVKHAYSLKQNQIASSQVANFLLDHEKINNQIGYQLSHPGYGAAEAGSGVSWISIVLALIVIALCSFGAKKIYEEYNPKPKNENSDMSLGGWLILPGIGLVLSPFIIIFQLFSQNYFDDGIWSIFQQAGYENAFALNLILMFEITVNIALLLFTALLIILYFQRRSSLPFLILFFYGANVILPILDLVLYNAIAPPELLDASGDQETYTQITRSFIGAAIWIPYFLVSERVKNTFTKVYGKKELLVQEVTTSTK